MPRFHPTAIIQDCWSSIGDITFYHRNGQCYWKRKPRTPFVGSPAQLDQQQVHLRAIKAWQHQPHAVQLQWNDYARSVPSHRPPYNEKHHISGFNLFVSAYHGFAQLGNEHVPEPQPFPQFPSAALEVLEITPSTGVGDSVTIRCRLTLATTSTRDLTFNLTQKGQSPLCAHIRYRLIDELTGYRNNWQRLPH